VGRIGNLTISLREGQVLWRASKYLLAVAAAILLLTLAVANRHGVRLVLDPFRPDAPVLSVMLPFYAYLMGMLVIGSIIGGLAVWVGQARWRRTARQRRAEAERWRAEADRLARERQAALAPER
jgi:uncharacterized integral membrane protein